MGANKLEARLIKKTLTDLCTTLKDEIKEPDDNRPGELTKEVFVIWGSLEVPRLFSTSYNAQRLLKTHDATLKQAVSLARY